MSLSQSVRQQRAAQRAEARDAERSFTEALFAGRRGDLGSGRIKAPPPLRRRAQRFGGGYTGGGEHGTSGLYDWFYELAPREQSRVRSNWMTPGAGLSPDEVEHSGLPMSEWLALTRGIDASKAVQSGRQLQPKRYGGRSPFAYLDKGHPRDGGTPGRRRGGVQFFTDKHGVVHPIRASEGSARPTHFRNAYGERVKHTAPDYGDDAPF